MLPDYYRILEIPENACLEAIKKAYRLKALKCHPDRGGSHEAMLVINEALEILSSPALRQEYDYARSHARDALAQEKAERTGNKARTQAENYPRKWTDFESWLTNDFQNATYGKNDGYYGSKFPTADGSMTGKIFIITGGIVGACCYIFFIHSTLSFSHNYFILGLQKFLFFACCAGGAWGGRFLHEGIGSILKAPTPPPTSFQDQFIHSAPREPESQKASEEHREIFCSQCGQKLRIPNIQKTIRINCPTCANAFHYTNN